MQQSQKDSEQNKFLNGLMECANYLQATIYDITKFGINKSESHLTTIDFQKFIDELAKVLTRQAEFKK